MRTAQLADHLPDHLGQVVPGPDPLHQRGVRGQRRLPVDPGHVGDPEVVAHQPALLGVHLAPLRGRVHDDPHPPQIHLDDGVLVVVLDMSVGGQDAQPVVVADDDPPPVARHVRVEDAVGEGLGPALDQVEAAQRGLRLVVRPAAGVAQLPGQRMLQPQQTARDRLQPTEPTGRHRHRDRPGEQPLDVHLDRHLARRVLPRLAPAVTVAALAVLVLTGLVVVRRLDRTPGRFGVERGRRRRAQRQQVRPLGGEERHVEDVRVVDRVEGPYRQEGEVPAVGGERRLLVDEPQRGRLERPGARAAGRTGDLGPQIGEPDLPQRVLARVRPGQPPRVRGEHRVGQLGAGPGDHLAHRVGPVGGPAPGRGEVDDEQPAVVRGEGCEPPVGRAGELQDPPQTARPEPTGRHRPVRRTELQDVVALGVGHPHHDRPVVVAGTPGPVGGGRDDDRQPAADAGHVGDRPHRSVTVGEPVDGPADLDRARPAGPVGREVAERVLDVDRRGPPGGPRAAEPDVDPRRGAVGRQVVEDEEVAEALVDTPFAVPGQRPRVAVRVVGVPAQAGAVEADRVDVAPALVVADQGQALADPHRVAELPVELGQEPDEATAAVGIDPELARIAAAVALPRRSPAAVRVGPEDHRGPRPDGVPGHRPPRQRLGARAVHRDGPCPGLRPGGPTGRARRQDVVVVQPAEHPGRLLAPVGEPSRPAAVGVDDLHLGRAVAPAGEGDPVAGGGEAGPRGGGVVRGEPPGPPAARRDQPDVVLGDEGHLLAADRREPQVRAVLAHPASLAAPPTLHGDHARRHVVRVTSGGPVHDHEDFRRRPRRGARCSRRRAPGGRPWPPGP